MLNVFEIFPSISGEVGFVPQGTQMLFIRLAGCNLNCSYCDTKKSIKATSGHNRENSIMRSIIKEYGYHYVMFTGGEPLLQQDQILQVIEPLKQPPNMYDYTFYVETNGTIPPNRRMRDHCSFIFDYKINNMDKMGIRPEMMRGNDIIKFVVGNEEEALEALYIISNFQEYCDSTFAIGTHNRKEVNEAKLLEIVENEGMRNVIINTQIHKFINVQ